MGFENRISTPYNNSPIESEFDFVVEEMSETKCKGRRFFRDELRTYKTRLERAFFWRTTICSRYTPLGHSGVYDYCTDILLAQDQDDSMVNELKSLPNHF